MDNDCALSDYRTDVETFYRVRYELGLHMRIWGDEVRQLELQNTKDINDVWWEMGLYKKRGHDYYGQTYSLVEDDGESEVEQVNWRKSQNNIYTQKRAERTDIS